MDPVDSSAAKSSISSPVRWKASFQSWMAVNLATKSPMPDKVRIRGASRQTAVSATTPNGRAAGNDLRLPRMVRLDRGLQNPSFDSEVGTAKYGSRPKKLTYFATSSAFPPPTPTTADAFAGRSANNRALDSMSLSNISTQATASTD